MAPDELDALSRAEQVAERFVSERPDMRWNLRPTLVYLPAAPSLIHDRHAKACLGHAEAERLRIVSTASRPEAVIAVVEAGLVAVVVAACRWRTGHFDEVEQALAVLGVELQVIREPVRQRVSVDPVTARMASLGYSPEQIAEVLAAPVEQVRGVLGRLAVGTYTPQPQADRPRRRADVVDLADARRRSRRAS